MSDNAKIEIAIWHYLQGIMYDSHSFFQAILAKHKKNPKQHVVDLLRKHARASSICGAGCFGVSLLCCCCCGPCGKACVNVSDLGGNWMNALKIYDGTDKTKIDQLFDEAMTLVEKAHECYKAAIQEEEAKLKLVAEQGSELKYSIANTQYMILKNFTAENLWFQHFIDSVYAYARFKKGIKYVNLQDSEIMTLMLALPMFYPATQNVSKSLLLSFDPRITMSIQGIIRDKYMCNKTAATAK